MTPAVAQLKQAFIDEWGPPSCRSYGKLTHFEAQFESQAMLAALDALLVAEREACAGIATMHAKRPQTKREHWLCDASWQAIQDERRGEDIASVEIAAAIRGVKG